MKQRAHGFTIVELLIVIVVIAILAALSYVGYVNISQRANNASTISAASGLLRAIQAYIVEFGIYPSNGAYVCVTTDSGCVNGVGSAINGSSTFDAEMARIGTLPRSVPNQSATNNGIFYSYYGPNIVDGQSKPAAIVYYLQGTNQNCGVSGPVTGVATPYSASTTGYSIGNVAGKTMCRIVIPGPVHA